MGRGEGEGSNLVKIECYVTAVDGNGNRVREKSRKQFKEVGIKTGRSKEVGKKTGRSLLIDKFLILLIPLPNFTSCLSKNSSEVPNISDHDQSQSIYLSIYLSIYPSIYPSMYL